MAASGVAHIKQMYLVPNIPTLTAAESVLSSPPSTTAAEEPVTKKLRDSADNSDGPKLSKRQRRGQNKCKDRPRFQKQANSEKLCPQWVDGSPPARDCPPNCEFQHDVAAYLETHHKLTTSPCHIHATYGKCPRGLTCLFSPSHTTPEKRNHVDEELWARMKPLYESTHKNMLDNESRIKLRSKKYDFTRVEEVCKRATSGPFTDEDSVLPRIEEIRKFDWRGKLYLSPLTTVGNLPFRRLCVEYGADVTCSEMSLATSLLQGHAHEFGLHRRHPSEKFWGVQLCANNVFTAAKAAQALLDVGVEYDFIDLNLGCPLDAIYRMGAGSGLMLRGHNKLSQFTRGMSTLLAQHQKLFTVKMRAGVKTNQFIAHQLIPLFKDNGVSMMTVHGRTREQRYTKFADWDYISKCAQLAAPIPLFGNGDVLTYEDYNEHKAAAAGVMIGRGALMKPWIFEEIREQREIDMTAGQRLEIVRKYCNYGLDHFGSDSQGVETTRRFLLEWLSFYYRYIPVGLLEQRQRMNDRPPRYKGRDEVESMLASGNVVDWVKVSEMFLGPVPAGFVFLPKHKANSWA